MSSLEPFIEVVAAVVVTDARVLLCQRPDGPHLPLLWEFPGGKIDPGESATEALERELLEEIGVSSRVGDLLADVRHRYPEKRVRIRFYDTRIDGDPRPHVHRRLRWIPLDELAEYEVPPANAPVVRMLIESLGEPSLH